MTKLQKTFVAALCALAFCGVLSVFLFAKMAGMGRVWNLRLPDPDALRSVTLTQDEESAEVSDSGAIENLLALLSGEGRTTREESIQDMPVNADDVLQVDFFFKEKGASTLFVFARRDRFYIEQPYNGIYEISENDYVALESFFT